MKTTEYNKPKFDKMFKKGTELKALILKKIKLLGSDKAQNTKPETDDNKAGS